MVPENRTQTATPESRPEPTTDAVARECPRVPLASLSVAEFRRRFLIPNQPVLLTGATDGWRAGHEWTTPEGEPDLSALARLFGNSIVPVADCLRRGRRSEMTVNEYAAWWAGDRAGGSECLYLKDWTFAAEHSGYRAYETPRVLSDDWLNEHWAASRGECGGAGGEDAPLGGDAEAFGAAPPNNAAADGAPDAATDGTPDGDGEAAGDEAAARDEAGDHRCVGTTAAAATSRSQYKVVYHQEHTTLEHHRGTGNQCPSG
jgi:hypothetical protein